MTYKRPFYERLTAEERGQFIELSHQFETMPQSEQERFVRLIRRLSAKPKDMVLSLGQIMGMLDNDTDIPYH